MWPWDPPVGSHYWQPSQGDKPDEIGEAVSWKNIFFFYIYADRCLCFIIMERRDLFLFLFNSKSKYNARNNKDNYLRQGTFVCKAITKTEPLCTHAVYIRSHVPYGFSKAISCSQKQSFLFIKGLWAIWKEVIKHFHLSLISNIAHLYCHWQRLRAAIKIYCIT